MFKVNDRILLSGHSHQAWPDVAFEAQKKAWLDASDYVDKKWEKAFTVADKVRSGYARLLDDENGYISLAQNTHELIVKFISGLPLQVRPKIITTDGEFHTIRRQFDAMCSLGIEIIKIPGYPAYQVAEKLIKEVDEKTALVVVSSVFYKNANIVENLREIHDACCRVGAELLIDAYHSLNVVPFSVKRDGLERAFITGAGYKYCQLGEGNGFLRFPRDTKLKPVITGWFSEFEDLTGSVEKGKIKYGEGDLLFAGATYDPTSNYRAAEVFEFFVQNNLTVEFLREINQHQVGLLIELFDNLDANPELINRDLSVSINNLGGFLSLKSKHANEISLKLFEQNVYTDSRGDILRLGPAPYISDEQIKNAMGILGDILKRL
ncbi:kynureninase [Bacteroidota bacterium]